MLLWAVIGLAAIGASGWLVHESNDLIDNVQESTRGLGKVGAGLSRFAFWGVTFYVVQMAIGGNSRRGRRYS